MKQLEFKRMTSLLLLLCLVISPLYGTIGIGYSERGYSVTPKIESILETDLEMRSARDWSGNPVKHHEERIVNCLFGNGLKWCDADWNGKPARAPNSATEKLNNRITLNMKAQGTSYSNGQPKDMESFVEQEIRNAAISNMARDFGWDEDITNMVVRGEWARQDQKKADHNTRKEATRSTAITAITMVATLGAGGALGAGMQTAMTTLGNKVNAFLSSFNSGLSMATGTAANIGVHTVKTGVQVIDGSRNGPEGMLAGLANGALGYFSSAGLDLGGMLHDSLAGVGLGLGISYDQQQGLGGMLGIGGNSTNLSVSFHEHGATTISGSYGVNDNINMVLPIKS